MTFSEEQVEWIVMEVIRRLGVAGQEPKSAANDLTSPSKVLNLKGSVITLRSVESRLVGISRVVVEPRAVVTPAVKDDLKQRNIELVREARP